MPPPLRPQCFPLFAPNLLTSTPPAAHLHSHHRGEVNAAKPVVDPRALMYLLVQSQPCLLAAEQAPGHSAGPFPRQSLAQSRDRPVCIKGPVHWSSSANRDAERQRIACAALQRRPVLPWSQGTRPPQTSGDTGSILPSAGTCTSHHTHAGSHCTEVAAWAEALCIADQSRGAQSWQDRSPLQSVTAQLLISGQLHSCYALMHDAQDSSRWLYQLR